MGQKMAQRLRELRAAMEDKQKTDEWYVYLVLCSDKTLYCGIAKDVAKRLSAHACGRGARYTRYRCPITLVWQSEAPLEHGDALRLERKIKRFSRAQKLQLWEDYIKRQIVVKNNI